MKFLDRAKLAWRILNVTDSNLVRHAETELSADFAGDDYGGMLGQCAKELIVVFASQGHSGGSAMQASALAGRLMTFQPITPLTGADSEWFEVDAGVHIGDKPLFQNRRCPSVFLDRRGAYDLDRYTLVYPDGCRTSWHGYIQFPYTPGSPIEIKVDDDGVPVLKKFRGLFKREPAS